MTNEERKQLCVICKKKVNKVSAEYMKEYRAKLKVAARAKVIAASIKENGL